MGTETLLLITREVLALPVVDRRKIMQRIGVVPVGASVVVAMGTPDSAPLHAFNTELDSTDGSRSAQIPQPLLVRWLKFFQDYMHTDDLPPLYDANTVLRYILGIDKEMYYRGIAAPCTYRTLFSGRMTIGEGYGLVDDNGTAHHAIHCIGANNLTLGPLYLGGPLIIAEAQNLRPLCPDAKFMQITPIVPTLAKSSQV